MPPRASSPRLSAWLRRVWTLALVLLVVLTPALARMPGTAAEAVWRPHWWPKAMPAGTGRAGIVVRVHQQRLYVHDGRRGWTWFYISTAARYGGTPFGWYRVVTKQRHPAWTYQGQHVPGGVPANPLGVCWLGLGMPRWWTGAPVGIHGTNTPWVIGRPVTHGCIRLRNQDALRLYRMVRVGTPVWILP